MWWPYSHDPESCLSCFSLQFLEWSLVASLNPPVLHLKSIYNSAAHLIYLVHFIDLCHETEVCVAQNMLSGEGTGNQRPQLPKL